MSGDDEHITLPTFDNLGITPPENPDTEAIARDWLSAFSNHVSQANIPGLVDELLHTEPWWRDLLALTWDLRSFRGRPAITTFLADRLPNSGFGDIAFTDASFQHVFPDVAWIVAHFTFATAVGLGVGTVRLVYGTEGRRWRAVAVSTQLDGLKGCPELVGERRDFTADQGHWTARRAQDLEFTDKDPEVLIIGAGHTGLEVAARLKHLGVSCLVVDKNARVGDNWRKRYSSLTLHDPCWANHLPYLPFPASWPVFAPAGKVANWLEIYVEALELNVWTSSEAVSATRNESSNKWDVVIRRADGKERVLHIDHVVVAPGFSFKKTVLPGQGDFEGTVMHSTEFHSAKDLSGKTVVVIGACTSGHDIASDCADHGLDVTMVQRSTTYVASSQAILALLPASDWEHKPTDEMDRDMHSIPLRLQWPMHFRIAAMFREMDKDLLDGLARAGYSLKNGEKDDCGGYRLFVERGGGYYIDNGSCQKIIDGKIKIRSGVAVARLTHSGVVLSDGSKLRADVVVLATGFDDARVPIRALVGEDVGKKIPPIWGLNDEGELRGPWRELEGTTNMWLMMGNFAWSRFFSKLLALQIKAKQAGLYGTRYAAPVSWE